MTNVPFLDLGRMHASIRADLDAAIDRVISASSLVGGKEVEARGLGVRSRDENAELGLLPLEDVKARILAETLPPSRRPSA